MNENKDRDITVIIKSSVGDEADGMLNGAGFGLSSGSNNFDVTPNDDITLCCSCCCGSGGGADSAIEVEEIVL